MAEDFVWRGQYRPNMFTPDNDRDQLLDIESAGSISEADLASDIKKQGIEINTDTMIDLFSRRRKALLDRLLRGYSYTDDIVQMRPRVTGVFADEGSPFDPAVHKCVIDMSAGSTLRANLGAVKVKITGKKDAGGAKISAVVNTLTGKNDGTMVLGDDISLEGDKIKIADETDSAQGVFFIASDGSEYRVSRKLTMNKPKNLIARVPADLPAGEYTVVVRTKFTSGGNELKTVREVRYSYSIKAVK